MKDFFLKLLDIIKSFGKALSKPADFFKEAGTGQLSSTRLMAFECVNVGLFIAITAATKASAEKPLDMNMLWLVFGLVTLGLTGKLIQKPMESDLNAPADPPKQ